MTEPYRPSNATEGDAFFARSCGRCQKQGACEIPPLTMRHRENDPEYPSEWIRDGNLGRCTAFELVASEGLLALTLWPEWAYAIAHLGKDVENRIWAPPKSLIGSWLAIHAGKHIGGKPGDDSMVEGLHEQLGSAEELGLELPPFSELLPQIKASAVVAVAKVIGVIQQAEPVGWYSGERVFGWRLSQIIALPAPVPCAGKRGLWTLPPEVLVRVREQLEAA